MEFTPVGFFEAEIGPKFPKKTDHILGLSIYCHFLLPNPVSVLHDQGQYVVHSWHLKYWNLRTFTVKGFATKQWSEINLYHVGNSTFDGSICIIGYRWRIISIRGQKVGCPQSKLSYANIRVAC